MNKVLKKSKYTFFIENEQGSIIIYHSMTGFILVCSEKTYIERAKEVETASQIELDEHNDLIMLLYQKGVLQDLDFDEDVQIRGMYERQIMNGKSLMLTLIVTRQCNFRCVYCGQKHEKGKRMTESVYDSVIKFIEKTCSLEKINSVTVSYFGGEPLLEYDGICYFLTQLCSFSKKTGIPCFSGMTTNAYLLTPKRFRTLAELGCLAYQITLDGTADTHDKKRYLVNGHPTWQKIVANLKHMKETSIPFKMTLRTNFDSEVLEVAEEYLQFLSENLKDDRISIYHETIKNHGNEMQKEYIRKEEAIYCNVELSRLLKEKGLRSSMVYHSTSPFCAVCKAGIPNAYTIDYNGEIKRCTNRLDTPLNRIGRLTEDGTAILNQNLNAKWIYNDYLSNDACKNCKLLPLCFGKHCPVAYVDKGVVVTCEKVLKSLELEEIINAYI